MGAFLPLLLLAVAANAGLLVVPSHGLNQDGLYLLDAKRALTVPAGALEDWNPRDATPCGWTGVSCDAGAVTAVSLAGANLVGPFPGALCRLPRLASLDLSTNFIGPDVDAKAVAGCKALARLDLSMNLFVGPLPDALADLPELVYLNLQSNNFSGPIPESFGTFKKLESLSLVYNLLGGEIPAFLGGVATLRELNLSYNPFAPGPVPAELGSLAALRVLWLASCNLVGSIPASLARLGNLTDLDLSTNALTGPIPPEIAGLTSAVQIELYNNSLSGPIPKGFGKLAELRSMDIAMNRLDGAIPDDLFEAPKLETLHLYSNSLTGPVPESAAKAASLVELRLFANRLNGTLPADLGRNTPLVCLDVSDNSISGEIPRGICERRELEELLMLNNALTGRIPEGLGRCHRLRRVRLSKNKLEGFVPDAVWGLPHLALLELNDNQLTGEISPVISGAANMSKLVISNNRLTGSIPSEIGSVAKLYELSADGNMLSGPLPSSLGSLAELGRLVLQNNSLSGQLLRGIHSWKKLSELNLADNAFTGAIPPELGDLPVLNYLDLSGNRLTGQVPIQLSFRRSHRSDAMRPAYPPLSYPIPPPPPAPILSPDSSTGPPTHPASRRPLPTAVSYSPSFSPDLSKVSRHLQFTVGVDRGIAEDLVSCASTASYGDSPTGSPTRSPSLYARSQGSGAPGMVRRLGFRVSSPIPPWPGDLVEFPRLTNGGSGENSKLPGPSVSVGGKGPSYQGDDEGNLVNSGDEEGIEDFFGQLWVVPSSPKRRQRSTLCWKKKSIPDSDLLISDCIPAARDALVHHRPRLLSIRPISDRASFAEVVRRPLTMATAPAQGRGRGRGAPPAPPVPPASAPPVAVAVPPQRRPNNQARAKNNNPRYAGRQQPRYNNPPPSQIPPQQFGFQNLGAVQMAPPGFAYPMVPTGMQQNFQPQQGLPTQGFQQPPQPIAPVPSGAGSSSTSGENPNSAVVEQELDPRYSKLICFNCGDPGHFVGNCIKPKLCFICGNPGHPVYNCGQWIKEHPAAAYFGSSNSGLGFYHLDVPEEASTKWINFSNCGVVAVKKGSISVAELEKDFTAIFCKTQKWPWQMRELNPGSFLVRFPPWKKVKELSEFPAFDLEKDGVTIKIFEWEGDTKSIGSLSDVWVTVRGILPKWCAWKTFAQLASLFGILMDVDWQTFFKSFYADARLLIACRDHSKIPSQRIVEMGQALYLLSLRVEAAAGGNSDGSDPGPGNDSVSINPGPTQTGSAHIMDTDNGQSGVSSVAVNPQPTPPADQNMLIGHRSATAVLGRSLSWDGFQKVAEEIYLPSPVKSLPDKFDYGILDDGVWNGFDEPPYHINVEEMDEFVLSQLGERSASMEYCSQMLQDLHGEEAKSVSSDEDDQMEVLDTETCLKLGSTKKNLLPFLDADALGSAGLPPVPVPTKKPKWGPVVAARRSNRNLGAINVIEKAKEYQRKKNLEIPPTFKGDCLARGKRCVEKSGHRSAIVENSLKGCSSRAAGKKRSAPEQEKGGGDAHCLAMMFKTLKSADDSSPSTKEFDDKQAEVCRKLILKMHGYC